MYFLPHMAAEAYTDLSHGADSLRLSTDPAMHQMADAVEGMAYFLSRAMHMVLPRNAEIYRSNEWGGLEPSEAERVSFNGLPSRILALQYDWSYVETSVMPSAPKRITLVVDSRGESGEPPPDTVPCITIFSIFFNEKNGMWTTVDAALSVQMPLMTRSGSVPLDWGFAAAIRDLATGKDVPPNPEDKDLRRLIGEFRPDLTAIVQTCHALRAGAILQEHRPNPRKKRDQLSASLGFTYHVLKLPNGITPHAYLGGTHASPRFHVRRGHLRTLSSGAVTFVRQCFVGNPERGRVDKHYALEKETGNVHHRET